MSTAALADRASAAGPAPPASQAGRIWRAARAWLLLAIIVAAAGTAIGLLHKPPVNGYLNPGSVQAGGSHALADVLAGLGRQVTTVSSVPSAVASAAAGSTLVITSPGYLTRQQLARLRRVPASILLVDPDAAALSELADGITIALTGQPVIPTPPQCGLAAAAVAGTADLGGVTLQVQTPDSQPVRQCYLSTSGPTLVQLRTSGHLVTILGTGVPLTNASLASEGNAALAINLLASRQIIWLVPPPLTAAARPAGPRSFASLVPLTAYLVAIQLLFALLLAAIWRARRLGRLVTEPLPVVVRAAETVEGHGRLYQSRRARGSAAAALRGAVISRITAAAGLPPAASAEAVTAATAQRTGQDPARIAELLYGRPPGSDQALVTLARDLDELQREVGMT